MPIIHLVLSLCGVLPALGGGDPNDLRAFLAMQLVPRLGNAWDYSFAPGPLPVLAWERPELARRVLGETALRVRWFDPNGREVTEATVPGRHTYYAELHTADGRTVRRGGTLFCRPSNWLGWNERPRASLEFLPLDGLRPETWAARRETLATSVGRIALLSILRQQEGAVLLAYLDDVEHGRVRPDDPAGPWVRDSEVHLAIRRRILGGPPPEPLPAPQPTGDGATPTLHPGTEAEAGLRPGTRDRLRRVCTDWAAQSGEPFVVLVARRGVVVLHEAFGHYPWGSLTRETPMEIASVTKLVTGLLGARFLETGRVTLDAPLGRILPDLPAQPAQALTLRHCFTHTTGLWGHEEWGGLHNPWLDNVVANGLPLLSPGRVHQYNGMGYDLAGRAFEVLTGRSVFRLLREQLFDPLGMRHTVLEEDLGFSCFSTAGDLARLGQLLLNRGAYGRTRFFSPAVWAQLQPQPLQRFYAGLEPVWGIGLTPMGTHHPRAGQDGRAPDATILGPHVIGHGSATGAILRVDLDHDLVLTQSRRRRGPHYDRYLQQFLMAVAAGLR